jgi:oxygen-independent coproporphyrinogen-3 oxidase
VARTIDLGPDSVTVYQMELPFNTLYAGRVLAGTLDRPLADWEEKRAWHEAAFEELARAGYERSSAYTMVRKGSGSRFVYGASTSPPRGAATCPWAAPTSPARRSA